MKLPASIIRTARAIQSALQPLTGERSTGILSMQAKPGEQFDLPRWTYFVPIIDGTRHPSWFFKVGPGPNADESWTILDQPTLVSVYSNLGGVRFNLPAGTVFQPDLRIAELSLQFPPEAEEDFEGGTDPEDYGSPRDVVLYEQLQGGNFPLQLHRSDVRGFPCIVMAFENLEPADGTTISQTDQKAVRAGSGTTMYKIGYSLTVFVEKTEGDQYRRHEGMMIAGDMLTELNDLHAALDGDPISNPAGIQVRQLIQEGGSQDLYKKFYVYTLFISTMTAITRIDRRTFNPWLRTVMTVQRPPDAVPATVDQEDPINLAEDMEIDMTPNQLDLALDGTFTRASAATLWLEGYLYGYGSDARRVVDPQRGVYLEPAVINPLGASSEDLTLWAPTGSVTVPSPAFENPLGVANDASKVIFASGSANLALAAQVATIGEPHIFSIFARSPVANKKTKVRLGLFDGLQEITSSEYVIDPGWTRIRWKVIPQGSSVTLRILHQVDQAPYEVVLWGASFNNAARWGSEYTYVGKAKDSIRFYPPGRMPPDSALNTPQSLLTGRWRLEWSNDRVPAQMTALGFTNPKLLTVGRNSGADLVQLELFGTPLSGGSTFVLRTRTGGAVLALTNVQWQLGAKLTFEISARGKFKLHGTQAHDGEYSFPGYAQDALLDDFLVIGDNSAGTSGAVPGFYTVVSDV